MTELATRILAEIKNKGDPQKRVELLRYFREPIETYGLSQSQNKEVADLFYPEVKGDLEAALALTEELLNAGNIDADSVGFRILEHFRRKIKAEHFPLFDRWVDYLNNWASTDQFTNHLVSQCILDDPSLTDELVKWTASENRWRRRAAATTMVLPARKGLMLDAVFRIADPLMTDGDDMAQKGVGWMLKEASKVHPKEIHEYLVRWKPVSPALILRYASEKLPPELKVYKSK